MKRRLFCLTVFLAMSILALFCHSLSAKAVSYPADPDAYKEWYLKKIGAYDAWSTAKGSRDVVVAVLDTGVDIDHPDLRDNIWENPGEIVDGRDNDSNIYVDDINGWDFVDGDSDPRPNLNDPHASVEAINHGTLVAGIIGAAGDNGLGVTGLNWRVKIMPLRVLDSRGQGDVGTVEEAIRYAIDKHADIINLSFIGPGFDKKLFVALRDAYHAGILVVAAVGNQTYEGVDLNHDILYPVCYSGSDGEDVVLGVAATDQNDAKAAFSNYGKNCVDISAPGVDIYNTTVYKPSFGYNQMFSGGWRGTSLAAPMVSGAAALIKSVNASLKAPEIRDILLASADSIQDIVFKDNMGTGRLNVQRALEIASAGGLGRNTGQVIGANFVLAAPFSNAVSEIKIVRSDGSSASFFKAYADNLRSGLKIFSADVDGNGVEEIIAAPAAGGGPQVKIFRPDGILISSFFVYDKNFRGGVNITAGDLDADGKAEIITVPSSGSTEIKIFRSNGRLISSFFPYGKKFSGGAQVTTGDINKDGRAEIIIAPGPGMEPKVKVFNYSGVNILSFLPFPQNIKSGVNIVFGDVDDDGQGDFVVSLMKGGLSEVRVFDAKGFWQRAFMVFSEKFKGGVSLAVGDIDRDGVDEIIAGAGPGGTPDLLIFSGYGKVKSRFMPFDKTFRGGVVVGVIKL